MRRMFNRSIANEQSVQMTHNTTSDQKLERVGDYGQGTFSSKNVLPLKEHSLDPLEATVNLGERASSKVTGHL
ncbi:hypothetical protein Tco_1239831 [Tanacetum coccineum]